MTAEPSWRSERRRKIISAAAELFAQDSYDDVQMDEIARRADVCKPTLYRYFPSKRDIYWSVCEEAFGRLEYLLDAAGASGAPAFRRLGEILRALVDAFGDQVAALDLLDGAENELGMERRKLSHRWRTAVVDRIVNVLKAGMATGDFAPLDPELTAQFLIGIFRSGVIAARDRPKAELIEAMLVFLHSGLAGKAERRTFEDRSVGSRIVAGARS